jgi:hypothetical protein
MCSAFDRRVNGDWEQGENGSEGTGKETKWNLKELGRRK